MLLVKIGGGKFLNIDYFCEDVAQLVKKEPVIIVHGANAQRDELAKRLGHETKLIISPSGVESAYTDKHAIEILMMAYAGLTNTKLVARLQQSGVNAVGLSGVDGALWQAKWKKHILVQENGKEKLITGSYTGRVEKINTHLLKTLLDNGYTPVISPPAITYEHIVVNADNDWASGVMAKEMQVEKMVVLFEAPGMLKDVHDESSLIKTIEKEKLPEYLQYAKGRMQKKLLGAQVAFEGNVKAIYWGDGRIKDPITSALNGNGTVIK